MNVTRKYIVAASLGALLLVGAGCAVEGATGLSSSDLQRNEQTAVRDNQIRLEQSVPLPRLDNSLERINIKKRLETFDDPNKVSYIYLVDYGRVMAFYTIKGKVSSGGKRLTSSQRQIESMDCLNGSGGNCAMIMEAPELDGSYGSSAPYIFFWTTEGAYVQWSGDYMLVDQPLKLTSQPELVRELK